MPYIVTTRQSRDENNHPPEHPDECRAVATLEEARQDARNAVEDRAQQPGWTEDYIAARETARALPEQGGSIGPLPGGTVIEVAPVSEATLYNAIHASLCCPACGIQQSHVSGSHLIEAYNAAACHA